jgi:4-amino-4-deoxy-L-arabinose transferase-like glycosyltransferase
MRRHPAWLAALAGLIALIVCIHLFRLEEVPRGLYVDESSIGINAASIAESGHDEHGGRFPVYFRAFGEFKNPVHVYAAALLFKLAGISVWMLRLTSALFFLALIGGVFCLARKLFPDSPATALWAVAAAGFLPWFFTVSRIAYEVISHPAAIVWVLCLTVAVYESDRAAKSDPGSESGRRPLGLALVLGLLIGLSLYTYSTARMLTPLFVLTLLAVYAPPRFWTRHLAMLTGAGLAVIPYIRFMQENPHALLKRFRFLTYIFKKKLTLSEKIQIFFDNYLIYWHPRYLLIEGDSNRRNSTGFSGEVFLVVFVLALAGLAWLLWKRPAGRGRMTALLLLNLLAAPVAASLTEGSSALRSMLAGLYLLIFSCFGFYLLTRIRAERWRRVALAAAALVLAIESGRYVHHYFGDYVPISAWAFRSYDFEGALKTAIAQRPSRIDISWKGNQTQSHRGFYRRLLTARGEWPRDIPVEMAHPLKAEPGVCMIYFNREARIRQRDRYPSQVWGEENPTILRCYEPVGPSR